MTTGRSFDYADGVARQLRIEYAGAFYYLLSRGNGRRVVFKDDLDRLAFLAALAEACRKTEWQVHAFCLSPDDLQLVIETPRPNLVIGMKWLLSAYTMRFNRRHRQRGHLFAGRYRSVLIDADQSGCLKRVCDYVHLHPARAKLIGNRTSLADFRWSSLPFYLRAARPAPAWLQTERLWKEFKAGGGRSGRNSAGRKTWAKALEENRRAPSPSDWTGGGWCVGDNLFRQQALERVYSRSVGGVPARFRVEQAEAQAESLIHGQLREMGWTEVDLQTRRKGDPGKVQLAQRLRLDTTVSLKWIASRLRMGAWTYVSNLLSVAKAGGSALQKEVTKPPAGDSRAPVRERPRIEPSSGPSDPAAETSSESTWASENQSPFDLPVHCL